jgi:sialate O-acetylesterase
MQFTLPSAFNASVEVARWANYPDIRLFTVGQGTTSYTPLNQLATIAQPWTVGSPASVGVGNWSEFSAVCALFARNIHDAIGKNVPIGAISSNWGGTRSQAWVTNATNALCNTSLTERPEDLEVPEGLEKPTMPGAGPDPNTASVLYNAMVYPYAIGPMNLKGFTWFQAGEWEREEEEEEESCFLLGGRNE